MGWSARSGKDVRAGWMLDTRDEYGTVRIIMSDFREEIYGNRCNLETRMHSKKV